MRLALHAMCEVLWIDITIEQTENEHLQNLLVLSS